MKKHAARIAIVLLVGATISLTALCVYQQRIIDHQHQILVVVARFIQAGCPFDKFQ